MPDELRTLFDRLPEGLARVAFSHPSWLEEESNECERLAFLGDSVLNVTVSTTLFPRFERSSAGRLTKIRAQAVSRRSCVEVANEMGVSERMRALIPDDQAQQAERIVEAGSVLAETLEAGIGACYLEYGYDRTTAAVAAAFASPIESAITNQFDFKSDLQEHLAQRGELVTYRVTDEQGPAHDRVFETVAEVAGEAIGKGSGRSKKESEQEAARAALEALGDPNGDGE
ncbi:MAG: putative dsRNA-binding protein [Solirubrobacterales bacterium]